MKRTLLYIAIFIFLVSFVQFFGCTLKRDAVTYVAMHLNPSVEFILDTSNRVVSINALNDEGELLLSYENLKGKEVRQAVKQILNLSSESGLLNVESLNGLVSLTIINEDAQFSVNLFDTLKEVCANYFKTNGIYALATSSTLPDDVLELAEQYNIPIGHFYLMLKLKTYRPDLELNEMIAMPIKEIVKQLHNELLVAGQIYLKEQKQAFRIELSALRQTYEENLKILFGSEYTALLDELALLEAQIDVVEGVELENLKNAIINKEQEIETLRTSLTITYQTEYQTLKTEYESAVQALKETYMNATKQTIQTLKATMQNRINEQSSKLQARIAFAKNRANQFKERYETFLALTENDLYNFLKTKLEELLLIEQNITEEFETVYLKAKRYAILYKQ